MSRPILVEVRRGPQAESVHTGDVAVAGPDGALWAAVGDPHRVVFWRSAAKPVQVLPLLEAGGAEHFRLSNREIAVMAASHSGESYHVAAVESILQKIGLEADALQCGVHPPLHEPTAARLSAAGRRPTALHCNCSGKHAGMLALSLLLGADPTGYLDAGHPVQRRIRSVAALLSGLPEDQIVLGVDGCGVPTFGLPLSAMASAYARLADPGGLPGSFGSAALRIADAMRRHPEMVGGTQRFDTDLMAVAQDRLFCKGGAEGVHCAGIYAGVTPPPGAAAGGRGPCGVALKVADGAGRAVAPAALAVLGGLGVLGAEDLAALSRHAQPLLTNNAGQTVGEVVAAPFWTGEAWR